MNEDQTPEQTPDQTPSADQASPTRQPAPQPDQPAAAGHDLPQTFASQDTASQDAASQHAAPQTSAAYTAPTAPFTAPGATSGASFGVPQSHAEHAPHAAHEPAASTPAAPKEKKSFSAGKVTAVIVAAALVGGAAGIGTSYLGNTLWAQPVGSTASEPGTITVNNPGSVNETTAIATDVLPSVVTIQAAGSSGSGSGSGVVLSDDGYVLTNTHVVTLGGAEADPTIRVTTSDGHIYDAEIVGTDPVYDLAVIKLSGAEDLKPIEFADSSELNVGSTAVAVGAPLGLSNSVTTGIVSALNRSIQIASSALPDSATEDAPEEGEQGGSPFQFDLPGAEQQGASQSISISVIQTDAAINPGNSGGALVDSEGKLIGINVAIATAGSAEESGSIGVGFAIPSNIAQRVSEEIIENGEATHGLLGATVQDAASVESAEVAGAVIAEATPGGAADEAGLRSGDIVTQFNGLPISGATDLTAQVRAAAAGSEATVTFVRDGETYEETVTLGELEL